MVAGMPDKIRRPDQTLLAECSRVCRRGSEGQARGRHSRHGGQGGHDKTGNHTADQSPIVAFLRMVFYSCSRLFIPSLSFPYTVLYHSKPARLIPFG